MQSLSDYSNSQLKSDILQMLFSHCSLKDLVQYAVVDRFWQKEYRSHLYGRSVECLELEPYSFESTETASLYVYVEENRGERQRRLFVDKPCNVSLTNEGRVPILREFFRLVFTCKRVMNIRIDVRDKTIDENITTKAIRLEFPETAIAKMAKISVEKLVLSVDLLFCLKWFDCQILKIDWADTSTSGYFHLLRGIPLIAVVDTRLLSDDLFSAMDCPSFRGNWSLGNESLPELCRHISRFVTEWQRSKRQIEDYHLKLSGVVDLEEREILTALAKVLDVVSPGDIQHPFVSRWPIPGVRLQAGLTFPNQDSSAMLFLLWSCKENESGSTHSEIKLWPEKPTWMESERREAAMQFDV